MTKVAYLFFFGLRKCYPLGDWGAICLLCIAFALVLLSVGVYRFFEAAAEEEVVKAVAYEKYTDALQELMKNPSDPDLLFKFREVSQGIDAERVKQDMELLRMSRLQMS